jgi:DNA-binding NarL/FixJ family response regulator
MPRSRVYVIWTHPLFHDSVRLLLSRSDVEIIGATSDHEAAQKQIATLAPDVVIVEQTDGEEQASAETISILKAGPRVIRLGMADNEISLYQRERRTAAKAEDLVSLITGQREQELKPPDE